MAVNTTGTLRQLVNNQFLPNCNYLETFFGFQTVFVLTPYSYRCCMCAFEHEYFDYLKDDGGFDEEMLCKVEENIKNGACPHVHGVPAHCIRGTCVDGLTVAAAAGSLDAIRRYFTRYSQEEMKNTGITDVNPFLIAILKNRTECVEMIIAKEVNIILIERSVLFIQSTFRRKCNSKTAILKEAKETIETCAENGITCVFQRHDSYEVYLDADFVYDVARCLALTFRTKNVKLEVEVTNYILRSMRQLTLYLPLKLFSLVAIMFDRPTLVRSLVLGNMHVFGGDLGDFDVLLEELAEVCVVLERKDCLSVFREFPRKISLEISPIRRAERLISLLHGFYDDFSCEIVPRLASSLNGVKINDLSGLINFKEPPHFCPPSYLISVY